MRTTFTQSQLYYGQNGFPFTGRIEPRLFVEFPWLLNAQDVRQVVMTSILSFGTSLSKNSNKILSRILNFVTQLEITVIKLKDLSSTVYMKNKIITTGVVKDYSNG